MHGDQRVEFLRRSDVPVREGELGPNEQRHDPRQHEKEKTCPHIKHSQLLVVDRKNQVLEPTGCGPALFPRSCRLQLRTGLGNCRSVRHRVI
jgi:hypothetical protein